MLATGQFDPHFLDPRSIRQSQAKQVYTTRIWGTIQAFPQLLGARIASLNRSLLARWMKGYWHSHSERLMSESQMVVIQEADIDE
jgi:hypothetical protein